MKIWIISGSFAALSLACYYFYAQSNSFSETIATQKALLNTQLDTIEELQARIKFEKKIIDDQAKKLEEYNSRVEQIKIVEKPVIRYREIVKTAPAEVIVETANEDTNEFITSITNSSSIFGGVHNN
jgi:hypothetical protein